MNPDRNVLWSLMVVGACVALIAAGIVLLLAMKPERRYPAGTDGAKMQERGMGDPKALLERATGKRS